MTQQMAGMSLNGPPPPTAGQQFPPPTNSGLPQLNPGTPKQMPPMGFAGQGPVPVANQGPPPQMAAQQTTPPMANQQKMGQGPPPIGQGMPNNNFPPGTTMSNNNYNNNMPPAAPPQQARPPTITNGTHSPMGPPPVNQANAPTNVNQNQFSPQPSVGQMGSQQNSYGQPPIAGQASIGGPPSMGNQPQMVAKSPIPGQPPLTNQPQIVSQPPLSGQPIMNNQPPMSTQPGMYANQHAPAQMPPMSQPQYPPMHGTQQPSFQPNVYNQPQPPQMYQAGGQMPPGPVAPGYQQQQQQQQRPGPMQYNQMPGQQYPGSPQYPQPAAQPQRRLDPDQMPNPIQVMSENQRTNGGVFSTNQAGLVPPLVTTKFVTQDQGQSGPRYIRSTMYNVPVNSDMMKQAAVPFSLIISPLAKPVENEYPAPIVDFGEIGPIRCIRCKAYMCPFMQFIDAGRRFQCLLCKATTEGELFYDKDILKNLMVLTKKNLFQSRLSISNIWITQDNVSINMRDRSWSWALMNLSLQRIIVG